MRSKWSKEGAGLVVLNPKLHTLTQRENRENLRVGKVPGMRGFAFETIEPGETVYDALVRILDEEYTGIPTPSWPPKFIGERLIFGEISADIFVTTTNSFKLPITVSADPEVDDHRWESFEQALGSWLRPGVRDVFELLRGHREEMIRPQFEWSQSLAG